MFSCISNKIKKISRTVSADVYTDTEQYVYTNPGNEYPSDPMEDIWPGGFENNKENEPASKKDDEDKKWDTLRLGPGQILTDWSEKGSKPMLGPPPSPKTDDQEKVQDFVKSKGDYAPDDLDRETWVGEGIIDPFNF
jgi:hypothetical protein